MASRSLPRTFGNEYFDSGYHYYFDLEIEAYDKYADFALANFNAELGRLSKNLKTDLETSESEDHEDLIRNNYIEDYGLIENSFNQILLNNLLIQYSSFAEVKLFDICDAWAKYNGVSFRASKLDEKSDLDKLQRYFKDYLQIIVNEIQPQWESLRIIKLLRNKLIHGNGRTSKRDKKILEQHPFLQDKIKFTQIDAHNFQVFITDKQVLKETSIIISVIFQKIIEQIK